MSNEEKDGGPAFARGGGDKGMSLLDYFAAEAVQGMLASGSEKKYESLVRYAYDCARAMLKERKRILG